MKLFKKYLPFVLLLFIAGNIFIFFSRDVGFEFVKYSSEKNLYPLDSGSSSFQKWTKYNTRFSQEELAQGLQLVIQFEDSASTDSGKAVSIAAWLYNSFKKRIGAPDDSVERLSPLLKYKYLLANPAKQLWCGQFQQIFGFFCTAAGLKNRYVELVPRKGEKNVGYHEVNEVWFSELQKWVMVDVTRNMFLINKQGKVLSAAQYLDYNIHDKFESLSISCVDSTLIGPLIIRGKDYSYDEYFNVNYSLRYYLTMNLSDVYTTFQKLKRYFTPHPWFEMYEPGSNHSNLYFRIKQFFFFGFMICMLLFLIKGRKTL